MTIDQKYSELMMSCFIAMSTVTAEESNFAKNRCTYLEIINKILNRLKTENKIAKDYG